MVHSIYHNFDSTKFYIGNTLERNLYSAPNVTLLPTDKNSQIRISEVKVNNQERVDSQKYDYNAYFRDSFSGGYVSIGLSRENLQNLYNLFEITDFKKDNAGNVLIKGEAEKFVSGWFADIAYKRGYISADKNHDGFLDEQERRDTYSFFDVAQNSMFRKGKNNSIIVDSITAVGVSPYQNGHYHSTHEVLNQTSSTIEEELNRTLSLDKTGNQMIRLGDVITKNKLIESLKIGSYSEEKPLEFLLEGIDLQELEEKMQEEIKKNLEEILRKHGFRVSNIQANANLKEVFKKLWKTHRKNLKCYLRQFKI